jgi:hypothetical protein
MLSASLIAKRLRMNDAVLTSYESNYDQTEVVLVPSLSELRQLHHY